VALMDVEHGSCQKTVANLGMKGFITTMRNLMNNIIQTGKRAGQEDPRT